MKKQEYVRPRNINLAFRVTEDERAMIVSLNEKKAIEKGEKIRNK